MEYDAIVHLYRLRMKNHSPFLSRPLGAVKEVYLLEALFIECCIIAHPIFRLLLNLNAFLSRNSQNE